MKNLMNELYHGRIPGWHSKFHADDETEAVRERIKKEKQYFASILSDADYKRFKAFGLLHKECHDRRYKNIYANAFKFGVMLMCAVFIGEEKEYDDEF